MAVRAESAPTVVVAMQPRGGGRRSGWRDHGGRGGFGGGGHIGFGGSERGGYGGSDRGGFGAGRIGEAVLAVQEAIEVMTELALMAMCGSVIR